MPETTPPLYDAWIGAQVKLDAIKSKVDTERAEFEARAAAELAEGEAILESAKAALAEDLKDLKVGEIRSTVETGAAVIEKTLEGFKCYVPHFLDHPAAAADSPEATAAEPAIAPATPAAPAAPEGV